MPITAASATAGCSTRSASISAGAHYTRALSPDGTVWGWGRNDYGQLGDGSTINRLAPTQVKGLYDIVAVSAGYCHSLALKKDGTVWAWGDNWSGTLGDGTTTPRLSPVQVQNLSGVTAIAAGYYHSTAIRADGTMGRPR